MSKQPNEGPLKPGGGRGGPQSAEVRQALEAQLKADFSHLPLQPTKTLGREAGTDTPEVAQILEEALGLFQRKNSEYGNAIESTGVLGAVVAATGDIARLRQMVLRSPSHGRETAANVRDKLVDILVQAAIGIYMVDQDNWEGK